MSRFRYFPSPSRGEGREGVMPGAALTLASRIRNITPTPTLPPRGGGGNTMRGKVL